MQSATGWRSGRVFSSRPPKRFRILRRQARPRLRVRRLVGASPDVRQRDPRSAGMAARTCVVRIDDSASDRPKAAHAVYPLTAGAKPAARCGALRNRTPHPSLHDASGRRTQRTRSSAWSMPQAAHVMRFETARGTGRDPASAMAPPNETGDFPQTPALSPVAAKAAARDG